MTKPHWTKTPPTKPGLYINAMPNRGGSGELEYGVMRIIKDNDDGILYWEETFDSNIYDELKRCANEWWFSEPLPEMGEADNG